MPKTHPQKPHPKGVGVKLVGPANRLIDLLITNPDENARAIAQVANEGPEHKQVLNAVLLGSLQELVTVIEAKTGSKLKLQPGETIVSNKQEEEITIPLAIPLAAVPVENKEAVAESIAKAPEHELLVYALLLQVIAWGTNALHTYKQA